jgi:hypothetical protein
MDSRDETVIKLSKTKIMLLLVGASVFVAAGIWMFSLDDASIRSRRGYNDPLLVHGIGLAAIIFFGIFGLYALKKLFDRKPALIFNNSGIVNNASSVSAGFIPWSEIEGAEIFQVEKQKMLIIRVSNPRKYIARGNPLSRALNKANHKMVGSPISISPIALEIDFTELVTLFDRYQRKYGVAPDNSDVLRPLYEDSHSTEAHGGHAGHEGYFARPDAEPRRQLLNWSPFAVRGTIGSGGIGILVLCVSSLDMLFRIQVPLWPAFIGSLLPMLIFFVAVPDFLPRRVVRPAQRFAAVWYLVFSVLSISLAASRGLEAVEFLLIAFIVLGAWPCVVALRNLRAGQETNPYDAPLADRRNVDVASPESDDLRT